MPNNCAIALNVTFSYRHALEKKVITLDVVRSLADPGVRRIRQAAQQLASQCLERSSPLVHRAVSSGDGELVL